MKPYYIIHTARGWELRLAGSTTAMPGGVFRTRKEAAMVAKLLYGRSA